MKGKLIFLFLFISISITKAEAWDDLSNKWRPGRLKEIFGGTQTPTQRVNGAVDPPKKSCPPGVGRDAEGRKKRQYKKPIPDERRSGRSGRSGRSAATKKTSSDTDSDPCEIPGFGEKQKKNCRKLLSLPPDKLSVNAFKYALQIMKINAKSFKTKRCYRLARSNHHSMNGLTRRKFEQMLEKGIKNKCQILINDVGKAYKLGSEEGKNKCAAPTYFIDLCDNTKLLQKSFMTLGKGTCAGRNDYKNMDGKATTLLGASILHTHVFDFAKDKRGGTIKILKNAIKAATGGYYTPAIANIGIQSTNSTSAPSFKYLHLDARIGEGCIILPPTRGSWVRTLATNGPSLNVTYFGGKMPSANSCQ